MKTRRFGCTKRHVAVIGQGTWYNERDDHTSAVAALRRGIELGMTHVDTAEMYLSGRAEEWVGEAILPVRDEVFLYPRFFRKTHRGKELLQPVRDRWRV